MANIKKKREKVPSADLLIEAIGILPTKDLFLEKKWQKTGSDIENMETIILGYKIGNANDDKKVIEIIHNPKLGIGISR